ncbi:hypothetical protein [Kocuria palustris]|uniref:hypothetical protein n=1 Tax=Kocuria palustris TaxID=71999 RepID=UPI002468DD6F|nr:hypothetical protein [Kocuria palustris]MDH5151546.1 hypothetical protein [Kocuria palustris]
MTAEPNQHQRPDAGKQPLQRILMWEGYETLIRDGFESLAQLQAARDRHYPDMPGGSVVDIVAFELARP